MISKTSYPSLALLLISMMSLIGTVISHSTLTDPLPYTHRLCKGCQACRPIDPTWKLNNTARNPAETWARGQRIPVRWLKNNHEGGFMRLSFVPRDRIYNAQAHTQFAFYHGCWEQNRHQCGNQDCGSDRAGVAFRRTVTVPNNIPDGVYIFAFMWYGGLSENRSKGRYGDYTSCSFVRVKGGGSVHASYRPIFQAGNTGNFASKPDGRCHTAAKSPLDCPLECEGRPPLVAIPQIFRNGKRPAAIKSSDYKK